MTMHILYFQDHDGHKANKDYFVELTLGRRLCENNIAIPYVTHLANLEAEKQAKAEKKAKEKTIADKLLADRKKVKHETTVSDKAKTRSKALKFNIE